MKFLEVLFPRPFTEAEHSRRVAERMRPKYITREDMKVNHEKVMKIYRKGQRLDRFQEFLQVAYHPIKTAKEYFSRQQATDC